MAKIFKHRTDVAFFDYKDFKTLQRYVNMFGQIEQRKKTGLTESQQRQLARAIKNARHLALMPFVANSQQTTRVEQESLSKQVKKLEKYIYTLKAARELNKLDRLPREAIIRLRDAITTARGAVDRYFGSDDSKEQLLALQEAKDQLNEAGDAILAASQYDLLDVADVAHLSALNEHIIDQLLLS